MFCERRHSDWLKKLLFHGILELYGLFIELWQEDVLDSFYMGLRNIVRIVNNKIWPIYPQKTNKFLLLIYISTVLYFLIFSFIFSGNFLRFLEKNLKNIIHQARNYDLFMFKSGLPKLLELYINNKTWLYIYNCTEVLDRHIDNHVFTF